jgi:NitT/TauT family transport system substrate-binding protein
MILAPRVPRWLLPAVCAALLPACAKHDAAPTAAGKPLETVRLQTDWWPQAEHGGFYQALAKGYYSAVGINAVIVSGGPGITPIQALMSGYSDLSVGRTDDVILDASEGLPLVVVAVYMEHDPQAILVHEEDTIKSFKDLAGRTIMAAPESDWVAYLKLHYKIDFNLIPLNFGMGEFMADKHFAQQCFVTNEPYFVRKNGGHPRTLLIADSGYNPYRCILTTRRYLAAHPQAVRSFVAASVRGWKDFMDGDPEPAIRLISQRNDQITVDLMRFSIQAMREQQIVSGNPDLGERIGLMTRKRLEEQARILAEIGITHTVVPLEKFATFDYLPDDLRAAASR